MLAALSLELEQRHTSLTQGPANEEEPKIGMVRSAKSQRLNGQKPFRALPNLYSVYMAAIQGKRISAAEREHIIFSWYSISYINRLYPAHKHMSDRERLHADAGFIFIFGDVLHAAGHRFDRIFSSPQASTCPSL